MAVLVGKAAPDFVAPAVMPDGQKVFEEINARLAKIWPAIIQKKAAPEDADAWLHVKDKRGLLEE